MERAHPLQKNITLALVIFCVTLSAGLFAFAPTMVSAQIDTDLADFQEDTGLGDTDIRVTIGNIVRVFLGFLGILAVLIVMYGGFLWMTAAGNADQIDKAKKVLINGAIGLLIIMSAFTIVHFVLKSLTDATGFGTSSGGKGSSGISFETSGALGTIIESHFPDRNDNGIPRNTTIVVTFKIPIDPKSIMELPAGKTTPLGTPQGQGSDAIFDELKTDSVEIYPTSGEGSDVPVVDKLVSEVKVSMMPDKKTFIFKPKSPIGSAKEGVDYTVRLTKDILNINGKPIFSGGSSDYNWSFGVSTVIDLTPPEVMETFPKMSTTKTLPRNIGVRITFDEPIFPPSISGKSAEGFQNVVVGTVKDGSLKAVLGTFRITNAYRTVEFQADDPSNLCGKNACGKEVYCLPGDEQIQVLAKAADIENKGVGDPTALMNLLASPSTGGYNGVVDMAGNSLNGGGLNADELDDTGDGPPEDNFFFVFTTSSKSDLEAPRIIGLNPTANQTGFDPAADPLAGFSKPMMYSSFSDVMLYPNPPELAVGFSKQFNEVPIEEGEDFVEFYDERTTFEFHHGTPFAEDAEYAPHMPSSIMDVAYNCFFPAKDSGACKDNDDNTRWCCNGQPSKSECKPKGLE